MLVEAILKNLFILILILSIKIYAQDQNVNEKVDSFLKYLKPYTEDEQKQKEIANLSDFELKHMIKLRYEAYEDDCKYLNKRCQEQDEELQRTRKGHTYGFVNGIFTNALKKKYSKNFLDFLEIPYLVKARILSIKDSVYRDPKTHIMIYTTVMEFKTIEVLKGNKEFKAEKIYNCYYGAGWRNQSCDNFNIGMTCLLPIEPRLTPFDECLNALITYMDDNCGLYQITDEKLFDKYNFFSLGEVIPWNDFVAGFNKKVESIKKGDF